MLLTAPVLTYAMVPQQYKEHLVLLLVLTILTYMHLALYILLSVKAIIFKRGLLCNVPSFCIGIINIHIHEFEQFISLLKRPTIMVHADEYLCENIGL